MLRGQNRRAIESSHACHIDPRFVDRILLDHGETPRKSAISRREEATYSA